MGRLNDGRTEKMEDAWEVLLVDQDGSVLRWQAVREHGVKEVEVAVMEERKVVVEVFKCLVQEEGGVLETQEAEDQVLSMLQMTQLQQLALFLLPEVDHWVGALVVVFCLAEKSLQRHQKNVRHY
jgi:hypothetical protein